MNTRIFVEKKEGFETESLSLKNSFKEILSIKGLDNVRLIQVYDIFNIDPHILKKAEQTVFAEAMTDKVTHEFSLEAVTYISREPLPGQFDQRADSAMKAIDLIGGSGDTIVLWGELLVLEGNISAPDIEKIKKHHINPVEYRAKDMVSPLFLPEMKTVSKIPLLTGFNEMDEAALKIFHNNLSLAMAFEDLLFIQTYFKETEKRNPTQTEIKVLDTYWSDHCRHTTFETYLENISFEESAFREGLEDAFEGYLSLRRRVGRQDKPITLMDLATIVGRTFHKEGQLEDQEVSAEINACSIHVAVKVDGKSQPWLLMFKNETHNHPTEIEPFGGAATCLGGAIRDPLSGRSYVYQGMRISGSGNIRERVNDTLEGKLPQATITKGASDGFSSYGNQIGMATTFVKEIYHEGYKAKHMEVGAVVGAVPKDYVRREEPIAGDLILLLGGRTGRDGIGGATGSSKSHKKTSIETAGSEVQKGNPPEERKIQRLFRNKHCTQLIKKCNDFGAGGVCVAIGELAQSIHIDLDKIPLKYEGLNGTEIAISESQERMAVVISPEDQDLFTFLAEEENLEVTHVATIGDDGYLKMSWQGEMIVHLKRAFLDTNGKPQSNDVAVVDSLHKNPFEKRGMAMDKASWLGVMSDVNCASQKGLAQQFDASIGRSTVLMPFGGKYQQTPAEASVQKIPVLKGVSETASSLAYGFNPKISQWSPFVGAQYAIIESISRLVASGAPWQKIRFSFQEYFEKLGHDKEKWGKPFAALLGAVKGQMAFGLPAIGGKDSMSGSFHNIHVPPTLIVFGVTTGDVDKVLSPEFKEAGHYVYLLKNRNQKGQIDYEGLKSRFDLINTLNEKGLIKSAISLKEGGLIEGLSVMTLGSGLGFKGDASFDKDMVEAFDYGSFLIATKEPVEAGVLIGRTGGDTIEIGDLSLPLDELQEAYTKPFESIYPEVVAAEKGTLSTTPFMDKGIVFSKSIKGKPQVYLPVFPGTNCEYDTQKAFEAVGGKTHVLPFLNGSNPIIEASIEAMVKALDNAQIFMLSGGFSLGDEPDGSGKFIVNVLLNEKVREAVLRFLERDGLILGICNGFQALVKSGLLPFGQLGAIGEHTLFKNTINRHISKMVDTKIMNVNSPWLRDVGLGDTHTIAVSHGEGRFVASKEIIDDLKTKGQIVTQYVDPFGEATMDGRYNPNGSMEAIEGIMSPDGKILGKMGHTERYEKGLFQNIVGNKEQPLFKSGVSYFK